MELQTIQTILTAAQNNKQRGIIFLDNGTPITFGFGGEENEPDTVMYDAQTGVITLLCSHSNEYFLCSAVRNITVFKPLMQTI